MADHLRIDKHSSIVTLEAIHKALIETMDEAGLEYLTRETIDDAFRQAIRLLKSVPDRSDIDKEEM